MVYLQQSVDELDIKEVAEERRLGVITDRQENAAVALVQAWAEATPVSQSYRRTNGRCSLLLICVKLMSTVSTHSQSLDSLVHVLLSRHLADG